MEPVHMEAVSSEIPQTESSQTSFNIVSRHNEDGHTFFGAITDPGNSVINVATDLTSYKFVCSRMTYNGNGFRPATGSSVASGKRISHIVISGIPFLNKNPSLRERILNTLITVDLGRALEEHFGANIQLYPQPGAGYYLAMRGDEEYPVEKIKAPLPHRLGYYSMLSDRINYSRFTISDRQVEQLTNPAAKQQKFMLMKLHNDISGIKQILNFNESE